MTKEIKFRAINKISRKVFEVCGMSNMIKNDNDNEPEWLHCLNIKQIAIREICNAETYEKPNWVNAENYHLLQYTGLKDKNGKEIYEGDILADNTSYYYTLIGWDLSGFKSKSVLKGGLNLNHSMPTFDFKNIIDYDDFARMKIVGNIYENPELLEAKEAIKNQLNFSDMVDSMIDKEEILNDLRDKYA